jgi:CheY-like chemotaxis protein/HPt (histidine-containing phosphotransfer) domain-containing protein
MPNRHPDAPESSAASFAARKLNALVAEDSAVSELVTSRLLKRLGHQVSVVRDCRAAVAACESQALDVALIALGLPEEGGLRAAAEIRSKAAPALTLIALTASKTPAELSACYAAGLDGHLLRPLELEALRAELSRTLHARAAAAANGETRVAQPLDRAALLEELGGDLGLLAEMAEIFERQAALRMNELSAAIARGDAVRIEEAAHALKSMIGIWQQGAAFEQAAQLEHSGRDRAIGDAVSRHHALERQLWELQRQIALLLATGECT